MDCSLKTETEACVWVFVIHSLQAEKKEITASVTHGYRRKAQIARKLFCLSHGTWPITQFHYHICLLIARSAYH